MSTKRQIETDGFPIRGLAVSYPDRHRIAAHSHATSLGDLVRESGASLRTQQRLFAAETGLSIETWRTRARLRQGLLLLIEGKSVADAALGIGYSSSSAFIAAFKRAFGVTPRRYRPR